jgi:hypothetical protein
MSNRWELMLTDLVPDYDDLVEVMQLGPSINFTLTSVNNEWELSFNENWGDINDAGIHFNSENFYDRINWSVIELEKWKCRQTWWNTWNFKSRREAEKFITIFKLKWTQ